MSQLSHAQFPLGRHPDLVVDHRRVKSAAVDEPTSEPHPLRATRALDGAIASGSSGLTSEGAPLDEP
jgi:hypothetical protein